MKKITYFLIALLLFIPIMVNAEECDLSKITIESITVDKATNHIMVFEEPHFEDGAIYLSLSVAEKDDELVYKIVVKNESNEDYEIRKKVINLDSDYMEYSIESNNNNIIKAKSTSAIYLRVKYKNEVDPSMFVNGVYQDTVSMKVNLKSSDKNTPTASNDKDKNGIIPLNPNTGLPYIIMISIILIICGVFLFVYKKKKISSIMILVGILLLPIGVQALCSSEIEINSMVFIRKEDEGRIVLYDCSQELEKTFKYLKGINMGDYLDSYYYYLLGQTSSDTIIFEKLNENKYNKYIVNNEFFTCRDAINFPKRDDYDNYIDYNNANQAARIRENACFTNYGEEFAFNKQIPSINEGAIVLRDTASCNYSPGGTV